jgi:hypothetical protein
MADIILGNGFVGNDTQSQTSLHRTGDVGDNGGNYAFLVNTSGPPSNQPDVFAIAIGGVADNAGNAGVVGIVRTTDALRGMGVLGQSDNGPGVLGLSDNSFGVRGQSGSADLIPPVGGGAQFQICGVQGSSDNGTGVRGDSGKHVGVRGRTLLGDGVFGSCADQLNGPKTLGNGIHGVAPGHAQDAQTGPFAGRFVGDVTISGNLFVAGTLIAGPGKPLHQIVYAGTVALDANGEAVITLPEGVGDFPGDFAYQLTSVGAPAPGLHVAQQIREGKFKVAGGASGFSVSWEVTGMFKPKPVAVEYPSEQIDEEEAQKHRERMEALAKTVGAA